jgi:hypothetical protein
MVATPPSRPRCQTPRMPNPNDAQLSELVKAACQHRSGSIGRNREMNKLIMLVQHDRRYFKGYGANPDHYAEAESRAWFSIVRNIDKYDAALSSLMTWINNRLRFDLTTVQQEFMKAQSRTSSSSYFDPDTGEAGKSLIEEKLAAPGDGKWVLAQLLRWLAEQQVPLEAVHVRHRPDVNCAVVIKEHLLKGLTFKEMSAQLGIPAPTVSNFWYEKCIPPLREFCNNLL